MTNRYPQNSDFDKMMSSYNAKPTIGQIKVVRTQNPQNHDGWHVCPDASGEPNIYLKSEHPELFAVIGTKMNASITDPSFDPDIHFAGLVTQLGNTMDDYWDFIYVGDM